MRQGRQPSGYYDVVVRRGCGIAKTRGCLVVMVVAWGVAWCFDGWEGPSLGGIPDDVVWSQKPWETRLSEK